MGAKVGSVQAKKGGTRESKSGKSGGKCGRCGSKSRKCGGKSKKCGSKSGQMNPSTQQELCRHPGWETMGDKRARSPKEPCRETTGDQMKGDKGRQMNPSIQRAVPGIQAMPWQKASRFK